MGRSRIGGSTLAVSYRSGAGFRKRGVISRLSDLIWPPRSLLSEEIVDRPGVIEAKLWGELHFLSDPQCARCGFPLPEEVGATAVCGACAGRELVFDSARAALAYDDHARRLVLDLKRGGRRDGLPVFAKWMAAAAAPALQPISSRPRRCIGHAWPCEASIRQRGWPKRSR
jgi:predicted amidophosphoribosyltransferase